MGPIGYLGPPPFVSQDDEAWPPPHWPTTGGGAPDLPPEVTAPGAPGPWPPPQWQVGDPNAQIGGSVQPSSEMPPGEPPPGVLEQQHQPLPPAPRVTPAAGKKPAPGAAAQAQPGNPYITGIEATADAKSQAIDKDAAAKAAEAEFRSQRGQGAYMAQALELRQADDDHAAAKKAGQEKSQALAKEVDDLSKSKIDRNRVFANQSTGERILTWAALFAGGMQSAFTGHNLALEAMNRILDRDFEQQKEDLATRKEALGMKRSMLSEELASGKDEYEARVKHSLIGYDMAIKAIDAEAGKFQSPQIQAAAQEKKAEIQGAAMDKIQDYQRYQENKAQSRRESGLGWAKLAEEKRQFDLTHGPGGGQSKNAVPGVMVPVVDPRTGKPSIEYNDVRDADGNRVKPTPIISARTHQPIVDPNTGRPLYRETEKDKSMSVQHVQTGVDPQTKQPIYEDVLVKATPAYRPHVARDPEEAKELGKHIDGVNEYMAAVNKLEQDSVHFGRELSHSSENSRIYEQDRTAMKFAYQHMLGIPRMTDTDLEIFNTIVPDPGHVGAWAPGSKTFGNMRAYGERRMQHLRREYGIPDGAQLDEPEVQTEAPPVDLSKGENWQYEPEKDRTKRLYDRQEELKVQRDEENKASAARLHREWAARQGGGDDGEDDE